MAAGKPKKRSPAKFPWRPLLLRWYARVGRDLPWRHTRDPYRIWISEIMLQQTQVDRVITYYERFLAKFPNVESLAKARWPQVLSVWRGLGYYRRARNLMRTAKILAHDYGSCSPDTVEGLEELPGIGPYTARAIAVFAFEQDELVLDTNVRRVLARIIGIAAQNADTELRKRATSIVPHGKAWRFHQALMDLGATICSATAPSCPTCPLRKHCAHAKDVTVSVSKKMRVRASAAAHPPLPRIDVAAGIIYRRGKILITRRPSGHLKGFWEFPGGKREAREDWRACLKREFKEELGIEVAVRPHDWEEIYAYPDRCVRIRFHRCSILRGAPEGNEGQHLRWVVPSDLPKHRFPLANERVVKALIKTRFVDPQA
jgi:A/G-specific adenine glycosylase